MDETENLEDDHCKAVRTDAFNFLKADEVYDYLAHAKANYEAFVNCSVDPPVKPNGGAIFIFDLGADEVQWEERKKKLRY